MQKFLIGATVTIMSAGALLLGGCAATGGWQTRSNGEEPATYSASPATSGPSQPGLDPGLYLNRVPQAP